MVTHYKDNLKNIEHTFSNNGLEEKRRRQNGELSALILSALKKLHIGMVRQNEVEKL